MVNNIEFAVKNRTTELYESFEFANVNIVQTNSQSTVSLMGKLGDNEYSKYMTITKGNNLTKIDLPENVMLKLVSQYPFSYTIPNYDYVYYNKSKIKEHLYEIDYGNIDYEYAADFFSTQMIPLTEGQCSALHNGRYYGRNLDWLYDNNVDFVVHTPKFENRYAVLGIAGNAPDITSDKVDQDIINHGGYNMFKVLPFFLLDGINEKGLFINTNVAPLTSNAIIEHNEIKAQIQEKDKVCSKMLPRYILDNFANPLEAIEYIRDYVTVFFPKSVTDMNYQTHYLIGNKTTAYALEFIGDKTVYRRTNQLTNFNIYDVQFNNANKVYTPIDIEIDEQNKPTIKNNVEKYGAGLERWNLISDQYRTTTNKEGMRKLLENLYYSNTYNENIIPEKRWHSEFAHEKNNLWIEDGMPDSDDPKYIVTVDTKPSDYDKMEKISQDMFRNKIRGVTPVWITVHSAIYDLSKKTLYLKTQEEPKEYIFML